MSERLLKNNTALLQDLKDGSMPDKLVDESVGSFFMCLFKEEEEDCIPLFFDILSWYTGEDYSTELEWVQTCLAEGHKEFEKFEEKIEDNPMLKLLMALCDD